MSKEQMKITCGRQWEHHATSGGCWKLQDAKSHKGKKTFWTRPLSTDIPEMEVVVPCGFASLPLLSIPSLLK